jgi:ATP-binding cassette subfamily B protein
VKHFSGGEQQKIAIARALYNQGSVMILDEPTAALDPISEADIYAHLNDLIQDKTTVFISHRMSSCRFCSDILVFNEGEVVERGTHDELLGLQGLYRSMWDAQAKYYLEQGHSSLVA